MVSALISVEYSGEATNSARKESVGEISQVMLELGYEGAAGVSRMNAEKVRNIRQPEDVQAIAKEFVVLRESWWSGEADVQGW